MTSAKYIGMDVHKESISIAVRNAAGKIVMECVIETKASTILQFFDGLRGDVHVTFEEGTWAAWLYDLLKPRVTKLVVCDPRRNALLQEGNQNDRVDARKLAELLHHNQLRSVYHGDHGLRTLKELVRSYLTITKDLSRVMTRVKAIYRSWAIPFLLVSSCGAISRSFFPEALNKIILARRTRPEGRERELAKLSSCSRRSESKTNVAFGRPIAIGTSIVHRRCLYPQQY
jgi:hypothetical protein